MTHEQKQIIAIDIAKSKAECMVRLIATGDYSTASAYFTVEDVFRIVDEMQIKLSTSPKSIPSVKDYQVKTKIVLMRVPLKKKRQIIFERDLNRARDDAASADKAIDRYNAARRVERLLERRERIYA